MKSVLLSIQPKWVEKILNKEKTIEIRKKRPKIETPFKVYIYQTKKQKLWDVVLKGEKDWYDVAEQNRFYKLPYNCKQGKVVAEFVCDEILEHRQDDYNSPAYDIDDDTLNASCLHQEDMYKYGKGATLYSWHISDLKIYDKPKELSEFYKCLDRDSEGYVKCADICPYVNQDGTWKHECSKCPDYLKLIKPLTRAPQSYCYVEELR